MEVVLLDKTSLRIKSKHTNFIVDPSGQLSKTPTDGVIILSGEAVDLSKVTDYRVVVKSPGEYEIGGVKISGIDVDGVTVYGLTIDNIDVLLAKASSVTKVSEKLKEYDIAIFNVDAEINQTVVTALEPRVVILYGEKANEATKALGKENAEKVQKFIATKDKLPEEMQVVVLS
ncbi:MAG: hypothetical protein M1444_00200 [Patescibacteria group bacterium]|nr:hypothetical protein [Patescibacteria group bacterium]